MLLGLTMLAPHTLVLAQQQHTWLYPTLDSAQASALPGQGPVDIGTPSRGRLSLASSADGQWLAIATVARLTPTSHDDVINVWFVPDKQLVAQLPVPLSKMNYLLDMLTMRHDGQRVGWLTYGTGTDFTRRVTLWDYIKPSVSLTYTNEYLPTSDGLPLNFLLISDREEFGIYSGYKGIEMYQLQNLMVQYQVSTQGYPHSLSPNATLLILEGDGVFLVRRVQDGQLLRRVPYHSFSGFFGDEQPLISVSGDAHYALVGCAYSRTSSNGFALDLPLVSDELVLPTELWDLQTGQVVQRFDTQLTGARWMALSPDGQYAVVANEHALRVFRVSPQPPFLQAGCILAGLFLALLLFWQGLWARQQYRAAEV